MARLRPITRAKADSDRLNGGVALKYNPGPLLLTAAVSGGQGWYDTDRPIAFPGFSALAQADHDVSYIDGRFRAAYLFTNGSWYAKPMVDFDATHISLDNVNEQGAGGASLNVRGNDETVLSATPALELGTAVRHRREAPWCVLTCAAAPPSSTIPISWFSRASKARLRASDRSASRRRPTMWWAMSEQASMSSTGAAASSSCSTKAASATSSRSTRGGVKASLPF